MITVVKHGDPSYVARFDPESGRILGIRKRDGLAEDVAIEGHFGQLGGQLVVLYRVAGELLLRVGDQVWNLDHSDLAAEWSSHGTRGYLRLTEGGAQMVVLEYRAGPRFVIRFLEKLMEILIGDEDFTGYREDSDCDLGLFISEVLNDPGRRRRIYTPEPHD